MTSSRYLRTFLKRSTIAGIIAILLWTIIIMIFEEKFIFFPSKYPEGIYDDAHVIANLSDCWINTHDGVKLHGWFVRTDSAIATIVMCHGNAGNISHRLEIIRRLQNTGFNILIFDYRGYGKSEGSPTEDGVYKDGLAAFDYAMNLPDVNSKRIILWGTSLGGAVAVDIALQRPALGLILESAFSSAKDVARSAYPYLPVHFVIRSQLNSVEKIRKIHTPLLQIHGNNDNIIPIELGEKLFKAANEPKELYIIDGSGHNDTFIIGGMQYLERVRAFILRTIGSSSVEPK